MKVLVNFIIQISGKPKSLVLDALKKTEQKLKDKNNYFVVKDCFTSDIDYDDNTKFFSGFLEVKSTFKDCLSVVKFIFEYNPVSIEIENLDKITIERENMNEILNSFASIILKKEEEIQKARAYCFYLEDKYKVKKN